MPGVTNPAEAFFKDGAWGWDLTKWRKLPLVFGYTDRWQEDLSETLVGDQNWSGNTVAVPAGYIYVAQFMHFQNNGGARGARYMAFRVGAVIHHCAYTLAPPQYVPDIWNGGIPMKEGDYIAMYQGSCLDGDAIKAGVWGYKMAIAE